MALKSTGEEELNDIAANENEAPADTIVLGLAKAGAALDEATLEKEALEAQIVVHTDKIADMKGRIEKLKGTTKANDEMLKELKDDEGDFDVPGSRMQKMEEKLR